MEDLRQLRQRAERWRRIAGQINDPQAVQALDRLATQLEDRIQLLETGGAPSEPHDPAPRPADHRTRP